MDPRLTEMIKQGEALQRRMAAAQEQLEQAEVVGFAAAGLVQVTVSGVGRLKGVRVDPSLCDPARVHELESLFQRAIHDGAEKARRLAEKTMNTPVNEVAVF